ncbi:4Fe-4S binding protein [Nitratiruptor sp. YY09-18]|uniref:4Fe-4S binding protein n=1 Tax=Nitratiruptor sp. YY09-18 TaxID=2724901 RepID=UPI0019153C6B|nr:4Fe-4S binding protein [Nitratiruptor sp. YY09-18]BCD68899.1 ferredoxin [Nitratiruptor sp. YY09-18]
MQYKQQGELFSYDVLKCLRTDYFHSDCRECLEICPHDAFFFDRVKLSVDFDKCTNCSVCIGVCPTEALSLDFFNPNDYVLKNQPHLSCKKDIPCLSAFDSEHFIAIALRNGKLAVDRSHCEGCVLNPENKTLESINARLQEVQDFLDECGVEITIEEQPFSEDRRRFFKAVFGAAKEVVNEESVADVQSAVERVPMKSMLLKNALKSKITEIPQKIVSTRYSFLADKAIDESCTNCGDCVQFCPTNALFFSGDGAGIWFVAGKCINCDICNDICKPKSISDKEQIDLVTYVFDRGEELIHHTIEICQECKTPFAYKGGEMICDRCKSFVDEFGDIFKLASDME